MKHSEIYRAAAKQVAEASPVLPDLGWHYTCCAAIESNVPFVMGGNDIEKQKLLRPFAKYFKPRGKTKYELWFGSIEVEANRDIRVLALLFMAAIAESEGN